MFFWAWLTLILYQFHFGDPKGFTGLLSIIWLLLGVKCYIWLIGGLNVRTEHRKFQLEKQLKSCMCHLSNSPWMFFYESWLNYAWLSLLHLFSLFFFFFFSQQLSCCIRKFKANSHESFSHIGKYKWCWGDFSCGEIWPGRLTSIWIWV